MSATGRAAAVALGVCATLLLLHLLAVSFLDRLIFQPSTRPWPPAAGYGAAEARFESSDGVRLHAYALERTGEDRWILLLHGNAGNASHRLPNAAAMRELGPNVLVPDYRGYGNSDGRPDEAGVYRDAEAAWRYLRVERGVPADRIVVFGRSLGGAIAVDLVRKQTPAGAVLESTFTSVADIAQSYFGLPLRFYLGGRFASIDKIGDAGCPLLFFHGDRDGLIRIELGRRLFDAAPEPKTFETIAGGRHNDTWLVGGTPYLARLQKFVDEVAPPQ